MPASSSSVRPGCAVGAGGDMHWNAEGTSCASLEHRRSANLISTAFARKRPIVGGRRSSEGQALKREARLEVSALPDLRIR